MLIRKNCIQIENFILGGHFLYSHHLNGFHVGVLQEEIE